MSVIDIVQLGFSLKNNSDAITNKLLNDLKKIQEAGKIKIEIDDSRVKDTLATLNRLANGNLKGLNLGQLPVDFLRGFENIGQSVQETQNYIDGFITKLQQIQSILPNIDMDKLTGKNVDWDKVLNINTNDIENKRKSIENYVVSEQEAVEKLKELQKQEQDLRTKQQSAPSQEVDRAIQRNYEEQIKYIERIKALKADVQNFDMNAYAQNNGFNIISEDVVKRVQSVNASLKETVQLIRDIGKVDSPSDISSDVLKNGIIRTRAGSKVDRYSTPSISGGSNNISQDTSTLKSSMDALKGSIDGLKKSVDAQGQAVNSGISKLTDAVNQVNSNNNNNRNGNPNPSSNNGNVINSYLTDLERESNLQNQILKATTERERVEERMDLNATRRARTRNERQFLTGLYPGGGQPSVFDNDQIAYAIWQENRIRYNTRLNEYTNRAQTMLDQQSYNKTAEYKDSLQEILNLVNQLNALGPYDAFTAQDINDAEQIEQRIQSIFNTLTSQKNKNNFLLADEKQLASMQSSFERYMTNNSKGEKPFATEIAGIRDTFSKYIANPSNVSKAAVDELATSISKLKTQMEQTGNTGRTFSDVFRSRLTNLATYVGSFMSFYNIVGWVKELSATVTDLNSKMVELSKVSNTSIGDLERQFSEFEKISKDVGGTISDTIQATADWSRNGLSLPDSKELARVAQIYKNVGDGIDINQANESLISTMRGFNIEAKDSLKIIDAINEVANTQPIDSGGIGEALKRSAASFQAANTDLNEAIALITAANTVTQNPSKVGF